MTSTYQKLALAAVGATITVLGIGGVAQATVLTFDDLAPLSSYDYDDQIPNGYGGFSWDNFSYLNGAFSEINGTTVTNLTNTGYSNGRVSGNYVAFNTGGDPALVSDSVFDFNSAYLTAAWNDGLSVTVEGLNKGKTLYDKTVVVDTTKPTLINFDYFGVDELRFTASGGVEPDYLKVQGGPGTQFTLDNFTFNETSVPEPSTVSGALTAIGIGVAFKRKLKRKSI